MLLKYPHTANTLASKLAGRAAGKIQVYGINEAPNQLRDAAARRNNMLMKGVLASEPWLKKREIKLDLYSRIRGIDTKRQALGSELSLVI